MKTTAYSEKLNDEINQAKKIKELEERVRILESQKNGSAGTVGHICESDGLQYLSNPPQWKCRICGKFYFYPNNGIILRPNYPYQNPPYPFTWC